MQLKMVDHFMFAILSKHKPNPPKNSSTAKKILYA